MIPEHDLSGRLAVVTGGAAGIGRAICQVLAVAGATVVVADRDMNRAHDLDHALNGHALALVVTDVTADLARSHGAAHILINSRTLRR